MGFLDPGKVGRVVGHSAWSDWVRFASQLVQFPEVFCAVPIGLGACAVEDIIQKGTVEDCRSQRMIVFQKASNFRQDVLVTSIQAVRVRRDKFCRQIKSWPIKEKLQRHLGVRHFQCKGMGAFLGLDILEIRQMFKVFTQNTSGQARLKAAPA